MYMHNEHIARPAAHESQQDLDRTCIAMLLPCCCNAGFELAHCARSSYSGLKGQVAMALREAKQEVSRACEQNEPWSSVALEQDSLTKLAQKHHNGAEWHSCAFFGLA